MPNRIIREGIIESEAINTLSWAAEVFYRRLLNKVDDFGRYEANVKLLRAALYPLKLDKVSDRDTQGWLQETEQAGLVKVYEVESKSFLEVQKFQQQVRAKRSKYPAPPSTCTAHAQQMPSTCTADAQHMHTKTETKSESNININKVRGSTTVNTEAPVVPPPPPPPEDNPDFLEWLRTMCACIPQLAAYRVLPPDVLEAAREAWHCLPIASQHAELLAAYYADRMPEDERHLPFWRPMGAQFFRSLGDVIYKHALRWKREKGWKPQNARKPATPQPPPTTPPQDQMSPEERAAFTRFLRGEAPPPA